MSDTPLRVEITGRTDSSISYRGAAGGNVLWFCHPDGTREQPADGEEIHLCMGGGSKLATYESRNVGANHPIVVTFDGEQTGIITLAGISAAEDDLNVVISAISGEKCAGLLKLSDEIPAELFRSATLNVADLGDVNSVRSYGCRGEDACANLLTGDGDTFSVVLTSYTVNFFYWASGSRLSIRLDPRLPADGYVVCWGRNDDGKGTPPHKQFVSISVGPDHSCGVTVDGAALCWGDNSWGQASPETICSAIASGDVDAVQQLLKGATTDCGGDTFLYTAIKEGQPQVVRLLLAAGADPDLRNRGGRPILVVAVDWELVEIVRLLIGAGADVNARESRSAAWSLFSDSKGDAPLYFAVWRKEPELVRILVDAGADVNAFDSQGDAPLHLAIRGAPWERVAPVAIKTGRPTTEIARILVEAGADVNAKNSAGVSPVRLAFEGRKTEIMRLLADAGAVIDFPPRVPSISVVDRSDNSLSVGVSKSGVETYFAVRRRNVTRSGDWVNLDARDADGRFVDRGLVSDTVYSYALRACNPVGCSEWSEETARLTEATGRVDVPAAPALDGRRVDDLDLAELSWNRVDGATYYQLYQDGVPESEVSAPYISVTDLPNVDHSWIHGWPFETTTYTLKACNQAGCSAHSNRITLP